MFLVVSAIWIAKALLSSTEKPMFCGAHWNNMVCTVFKKKKKSEYWKHIWEECVSIVLHSKLNGQRQRLQCAVKTAIQDILEIEKNFVPWIVEGMVCKGAEIASWKEKLKTGKKNYLFHLPELKHTMNIAFHD